jgi:hypothetical protein
MLKLFLIRFALGCVDVGQWCALCQSCYFVVSNGEVSVSLPH